MLQGAERDVVVLTTCRTKNVGSAAFVESPYRLNVAVTRARRHLLVVGNAGALRKGRLWPQILDRAAFMVPRSVCAVIRNAALPDPEPAAAEAAAEDAVIKAPATAAEDSRETVLRMLVDDGSDGE